MSQPAAAAATAAAQAEKPVATDEPHLNLIHDLEAQKPSDARTALLIRARAGDFHDDLSQSATPKLDLANALEAAGYTDMLDKLDEYDNDVNLTEEEEKAMREAFGGSGKVTDDDLKEVFAGLAAQLEADKAARSKKR